MLPKAPAGLGASGRRLWRSVVTDFDLDEHELVLMRQACRTADLCDRLEKQLDRDELMASTSQGLRVHPAASELRQQRIALARLLVALRVPADEADTRSGQRRGIRGFYGLGGAE